MPGLTETTSPSAAASIAAWIVASSCGTSFSPASAVAGDPQRKRDTATTADSFRSARIEPSIEVEKYQKRMLAATAAANQVQVSVEDAVAALDSNAWEFVVAEERPRAVAGTGVDAVIRARRRI